MMDGQRKGDVRVYVVSGLFFSCIISGGVFLGVYMFLPETQSSSWYPIAGMVLVSIPWAFWLFTFLYRCIRPQQPAQPDGSHKSGGGGSVSVSSREPVVVQTAAVAASVESSDCESPAANSPGGERRVQFGPVVVLGNEGGDHNEQQHTREPSEVSNCSRESEIPLRFSA